MSSSGRFRRLTGGLFLGMSVAVGAGALVCVTHPAAAVGVLAAAQTAVTCATLGTAPCASWTNTSSGIGVLGASNTGTGLRGTSNTNFGIKGSSKTTYGMFGTSTSGGAGVAGTGPLVGVYGFTPNLNGIGLLGAQTTGKFGIGVSGEALGGIGVNGLSTTGTGVNAASASGSAVVAASGDCSGLVASNVSNIPGKAAVVAVGSNYALQGASDGLPLILTDIAGHVVFSVDAHGNVAYHGALQNFAPAARGATATAFSPKTTQPTIEDTGTAQLVGGAAAVRLDPAFATSIDPQAGYRVFLTPNGDTPHGLFVAAKSITGFIVREAQAGRSTVSFDYRVVATALGQAGQRMAVTTAAAARVPVPVISKASVPAVPAAPAAAQQ